MIQQTARINIIERRAFTCLVFAILVLVGLYGYFISTSIVNVLVREEIENSVRVYGSTIGELESQYLGYKDVINVEFAYSIGFEDIEKKTFVTRSSSLSKELTLNVE